jgi:hypothetical protein
MRATPKKPAKAPVKKTIDASKRVLKLEKAARNALVEIQTARRFMDSEWLGPQHEALDWAESLLTKALA